MQPIEDGTYDGVVVEARRDEDGVLHVEIAVSAGPHRGDVLPVAVGGRSGDPVLLLGLPARVVVADGRPRVTIER